MKKNRLQALYNEAHNKVVNQLIEAGDSNPVKEVALPLLNNSGSFAADDINRIIITKQQNNSDIDKVEINKDNDEFYVIIEDKSSSDVKKFIDSNIITIDEPIQEQVLGITEETKKSSNSISLSDNIKTLLGKLKDEDFNDINIAYHYQKELYNHNGSDDDDETIEASGNVLEIPTDNNLIIRETITTTNENSLKIETSLIRSIIINDEIENEDIEKIHIDIYDSLTEQLKKTLKYNKDYFYYNK